MAISMQELPVAPQPASKNIVNISARVSQAPADPIYLNDGATMAVLESSEVNSEKQTDMIPQQEEATAPPTKNHDSSSGGEPREEDSDKQSIMVPQEEEEAIAKDTKKHCVTVANPSEEGPKTKMPDEGTKKEAAARQPPSTLMDYLQQSRDLLRGSLITSACQVTETDASVSDNSSIYQDSRHAIRIESRFKAYKLLGKDVDLLNIKDVVKVPSRTTTDDNKKGMEHETSGPSVNPSSQRREKKRDRSTRLLGERTRGRKAETSRSRSSSSQRNKNLKASSRSPTDRSRRLERTRTIDKSGRASRSPPTTMGDSMASARNRADMSTRGRRTPLKRFATVDDSMHSTLIRSKFTRAATSPVERSTRAKRSPLGSPPKESRSPSGRDLNPTDKSTRESRSPIMERSTRAGRSMQDLLSPSLRRDDSLRSGAKRDRSMRGRRTPLGRSKSVGDYLSSTPDGNTYKRAASPIERSKRDNRTMYESSLQQEDSQRNRERSTRASRLNPMLERSTRAKRSLLDAKINSEKSTGAGRRGGSSPVEKSTRTRKDLLTSYAVHMKQNELMVATPFHYYHV